MIECPNCKRNNPDGTTICIYCGELLIDPEELKRQRETRQLEGKGDDENQPRWGTARFDEQTQLILRMTDVGQIEKVKLSRDSAVVLGRTDPDTGKAPEVDLEPYDASELGVSRKHAQIEFQEGALRITDLGSVNGTFLNGFRLNAHQSRILRDGDEVRVGQLKLQVIFTDWQEDDTEDQAPIATEQPASAPEQEDPVAEQRFSKPAGRNQTQKIESESPATPTLPPSDS